jgi:hypothetical protein
VATLFFNKVDIALFLLNDKWIRIIIRTGNAGMRQTFGAQRMALDVQSAARDCKWCVESQVKQRQAQVDGYGPIYGTLH